MLDAERVQVIFDQEVKDIDARQIEFKVGTAAAGNPYDFIVLNEDGIGKVTFYLNDEQQFADAKKTDSTKKTNVAAGANATTTIELKAGAVIGTTEEPNVAYSAAKAVKFGAANTEILLQDKMAPTVLKGTITISTANITAPTEKVHLAQVTSAAKAQGVFTIQYSEDLNDTLINKNTYTVDGYEVVSATEAAGVVTITLKENLEGTEMLKVRQATVLEDAVGNKLDASSDTVYDVYQK